MSEFFSIDSPEILPVPKLVIREETREEGRDEIANTVKKLPFFKRHNYSVYLPLSEKILHPQYAGNILIPEYGDESYRIGVQMLDDARGKIEQAFPIFEEFKKNWGFHIPEQYELIVSKYGVGGAYQADSGTALILLSGLLQGDIRPVRTPLHEMVHMGVEHLVQEYTLSHDEKEGLVDGICEIGLGKILPDYKVQSRSHKTGILDFITEDSLVNLPQSIESYKSKKR